MKNNKGFTLIEMLVVVAIILALSVSAGLSADFSLKKARKNEYKDLMWDVFKAADVYSELSDFATVCTDINSGCEVPISDLINKGLLDENIQTKQIPIYSFDKTFGDSTKLYVRKVNGVKIITLNCDGATKCSANDSESKACHIALEDGTTVGSISFVGLEKYHKDDLWGKCQ